jgi:hypothetical protein
VLIPFNDPDPASVHTIDDSDLIVAQSRSGSAICLFIKLGKAFHECSTFRAEIDAELREIFHRCDAPVDSRIRRIYTILLFFTLKVGLLMHKGLSNQFIGSSL